MKTKLTIIAIAAITLLSFTVASTKKVTVTKNQNEVKSSQSGFTLQDKNQFQIFKSKKSQADRVLIQIGILSAFDFLELLKLPDFKINQLADSLKVSL